MLLYIEGGWSHALNGNPRGGSRAIPAISVIDLYVCVWDILHQFGSVFSASCRAVVQAHCSARAFVYRTPSIGGVVYVFASETEKWTAYAGT